MLRAEAVAGQPREPESELEEHNHLLRGGKILFLQADQLILLAVCVVTTAGKCWANAKLTMMC